MANKIAAKIDMNLLSMLFQQASKIDRANRPYIEVPYGVDTTLAVDNAIKAGFPVDYGDGNPRHCAPSVHYTR